MKEYYEYYLTLHQNPKCRLLHFIGQCVTIGYCANAILSKQWYLLLFAPFIVYPFAWTGHAVFEKNDPLAWKGMSDYGITTLKAKLCDLIMFKDILRGHLKIW